MKKIFNIVLVTLLLSACSQESAEKKAEAEYKTETEKKAVLSDIKAKNKEKALQGYQDQIQKAKDLEKKMLKHAEDQKKAMNNLDGN